MPVINNLRELVESTVTEFSAALNSVPSASAAKPPSSLLDDIDDAVDFLGYGAAGAA